MLDVSKMVDAVLDVIDKPLRAMHERIKLVEARAPEKGEKGERGEMGMAGFPGKDGVDGKDGRDGKDIEATALPDNLVEQLKSAAAALAEPPPVPPVAPIAPPQPIPRSVTGAVITRGGELAVSYSDGSSERLGYVVGPQGEKGAQGEPGRDGIGMKGEDGPAGRDGVSVTATSINRDGELMMTLSDGSVLSPGIVTPKRK